jgi:hypothetical protein
MLRWNSVWVGRWKKFCTCHLWRPSRPLSSQSKLVIVFTDCSVYLIISETLLEFFATLSINRCSYQSELLDSSTIITGCDQFACTISAKKDNNIMKWWLIYLGNIKPFWPPMYPIEEVSLYHIRLINNILSHRSIHIHISTILSRKELIILLLSS